MSGRTLTLDEVKDRFWSRVDKTGECWTWNGALFTNGYGAFSWWRKVKKAHRVAWEWSVGPIPEGLTLDHLCHVRHCVNPSHLEPVELGENSRRGNYNHYGSSLEMCRFGHRRQPGETRGCPVCQERMRNRDRTRRNQRDSRVTGHTRIALDRQKAQIGAMLLHPERHGFADRDAVIRYLWPSS